MDKPINLGMIPQLLSDVSFCTQVDGVKTSTYYKMASSIFKYLCRCQKQNGSIYDSNISSTLDAQYHQANFSLSAIILYLINRDDSYYIKALSTLKYYTNIPLEVRKGGCDFSNFPILLSYSLLHHMRSEHPLRILLQEYIAAMPNYASMAKKHTYGNNFITLRALNQLLRFKLLGEKEDIQSAQYHMDCTLKWQFDDGIFYDYPRYLNYGQGIPSLAYHSKITLIILLFGIVSKEHYIIDKAIHGLDALAKLTSYDGEAFYYGRTNNALYGYACGILAYRIASSITRDVSLAEKYKKCERALFRFCSRYVAKDGHLYIVPNDLENERCGFDNYMYVTVYNAFIMSMLLLSSIIKENTFPLKTYCSPEVHYLEESGFIVKKGEKITTAFNLKGHNYYQQYMLDPRFTCCTPLLLKFNGHDILPTVPFSSPVYPRNKSESVGEKLWRKIKEARAEFNSWGYLQCFNPLHAGFMPYLETKNTWYMPLYVKETVVSETGDLLIVKAFGKYMSIRRRGFLSLAFFIADSMKNIVRIPLLRAKDVLIRESDSYFERTIIIHDHFIHFADKMWGNISGKVCFSLRTYRDGDNKSDGNQFVFKKTGYGFALLLEEGEILRGRNNMCSSKGRTVCWDLVNEGQEFPQKSKKTVKLKHTLIPFDVENDLKRSISLFRLISREFDKYTT